MLNEANIIEERSKRIIPYSVPMMIFLCSLIFLCFAFVRGWNGSIFDMFPFRQTQTAITVKYLLRGGPWLAYETPVFGPPWSIPLEFPLYQWMVALVAKTGIFPMEQAGRFVSIVFFLSSIYPFYRIMKALGLAGSEAFMVISLYCFSPQYLFWSRTFMIESTALALAMYYIWFITLYITSEGSWQKRWLILFCIAAIGALAVMVKVTTFFPFVPAGMLFFGWKWAKCGKEKGRWERSSHPRLMEFVFFALIVPLTALILWTSYSDSLKSLNPLGRVITSSALKTWNFGTLSQRLAAQTWKVFFLRTVPDLIGSSWLLIVVIWASLFCRKERRIAVFVLLALFLLSLLTFTNLYFIHAYYAYANGVFLIAACGLVCSDLWKSGGYLKRIAGWLILSSIIILSSMHYLKAFLPLQGRIDIPANLLLVKNDMEHRTGESDIIVIVNGSWSSEWPYYLDRRAIMFRGPNINPKLDTSCFSEVKGKLGSRRIGAILFSDAYNKETLVRDVLQQFDFRSVSVTDYGSIHVYYHPFPFPKTLDADIVASKIPFPVTFEGFGGLEGPYPQWNLPQVRWLKKSSAKIEIKDVPDGKFMKLAMSFCPHVRHSARMAVRINNKDLTTYYLKDENTWQQDNIDIPLQKGSNIIELLDRPSPGQAPPPDSLYMLFRVLSLKVRSRIES